MEERLYEVVEGKSILASHIRLENALLFMMAYFEKYNNDPGIELLIREMPRCECMTRE